MKSDIAIATVSWIRTPDEREVVTQTLQHLSKLNIPLIVFDSGSKTSDQNLISKIKNVVFFESQEGMTKRLVLSQQEAAKYADTIFYLQSDKVDLAKNYVKPMIDYYLSLDKKGILIPSRTKESFATYPLYQQKHEEFLNWFIGDYIGIKQDYYAGPKIYPAMLTKYFTHLKGELWWGIEAFLYVVAKRLEIPFDFYQVNITSPKDVGDNEFIKKYRTQVTHGQLDAFLQALTLNLD